jgi:hypothetical protein
MFSFLVCRVCALTFLGAAEMIAGNPQGRPASAAEELAALAFSLT